MYLNNGLSDPVYMKETRQHHRCLNTERYFLIPINFHDQLIYSFNIIVTYFNVLTTNIVNHQYILITLYCISIQSANFL